MILTLWALPVTAQEAMLPGAFQNGYEGRTLRFLLPDGSLWGREHWPRRDQSIWQSEDGTCMTCDVAQEGPWLCFDCDDGVYSCWQHFELPGGRIRITSDAGATAIGKDEGDAPLICGVPNV